MCNHLSIQSAILHESYQIEMPICEESETSQGMKAIIH